MVNECLHIVTKVSTVLDFSSELNGLLFDLLLECFFLCSLHLSGFHDILMFFLKLSYVVNTLCCLQLTLGNSRLRKEPFSKEVNRIFRLSLVYYCHSFC